MSMLLLFRTYIKTEITGSCFRCRNVGALNVVFVVFSVNNVVFGVNNVGVNVVWRQLIAQDLLRNMF